MCRLYGLIAFGLELKPPVRPSKPYGSYTEDECRIGEPRKPVWPHWATRAIWPLSLYQALIARLALRLY